MDFKLFLDFPEMEVSNKTFKKNLKQKAAVGVECPLKINKYSTEVLEALRLEHTSLGARNERLRKTAVAARREEARQKREAFLDECEAGFQYLRSRDWAWWCRHHPNLAIMVYSRYSKEQRAQRNKVLYKNHRYAEHLYAAYRRHKRAYWEGVRLRESEQERINALKAKFYNNRFSFLGEQTCKKVPEEITFGDFETDEPACEVQVEERVARFSINKNNLKIKSFAKSDKAQERESSIPIKTEIPLRDINLLEKLKCKLFLLNFSKRNLSFSIFCKRFNIIKSKLNYYSIYKIIVDYCKWQPTTGIPIAKEVRERANSMPYKDLSCNNEVILPEMEEPDAHGSEELKTEQASNVVLTEVEQTSTAIATIPQFKTWSEYCSSEQRIDYENLVNRWIQIETAQWKNDMVLHTDVVNPMCLPLAYVQSVKGAACSIPNSVPFLIHRYWRGDLEVKIHVNSNKFQVGSLQCSWLYQPDFDDHIDDRTNVYNLSQTNHVIVNASSSNEATLCIPFKYYIPLLHTKPRSDMSSPLNLGRLYVKVLNQLSVSANATTYCSVTVFCRCINNEFTGMLSGDIDALPPPTINAEMNVGRSLGELALNTLFPDNNRDNPPTVAAPRYLVPTATHSWAAGTGISEPLHPLRLDAKGQTPHPPGIEVNNEMQISNVTRTFGLLHILKWSKDSSKSYALYKCPVAPLTDINYYSFITGDASKSKLNKYRLPPVAVAASMFMSWRGTLEYRFDVVASQFHTGRLMVGFIPGVTEENKVTLDQLKCSTNTVFSITDTTSFTYQVPFISNKPAWPRRYSGDYETQDNEPPAWLYVFIVNELIPMQSVPESVYINVYVRGGEDFELFVPVQPSIGLCWNNDYISAVKYPTKIMALQGYSPYYSGKFEDFDYCQTFRWGQYSHQIAKFNGQNYYDEAKSSCTYCMGKSGEVPKYKDATGTMVEVMYAIFIYLTQLDYIVGIPCLSEDAAKNLAQNLFIHKLALNDGRNSEYIVSNSLSTTDNTYSKGNPQWSVKSWNPNKIEGEIGEQNLSKTLVGIGTTNTLNQGYLIYGEHFSDFKDLCRRYQFYGAYQVSLGKISDCEFVRFKFPAVPTGLALNIGTAENINQIHNRLRDGHIPIIASGYRYYRGGLRFRIMCNTNSTLGFTFIVQHRPDRGLLEYNISSGNAMLSGDSVMNHTYGSYIQHSHVNNIIEFEIPFYLLGMYGLLQRVKSGKRLEYDDFVSLGDVCVSVISASFTTTSNIRFEIFYSVADDMSFSTFQGFPPMVLCNDIPLIPRPTITGDDFTCIEIPSPIEHEMGMWDFNLKQAVSTGIEDAAQRASDVVSDRVSQAVDTAIASITDKFKDYDFTNTENLVLIGLELMHLLNHRDISTLALVVVKVLIHFKMIVVNNILSSVKTLAEMLRMWVSRSTSTELQAEEVSIHHEMDVKDILVDEWSGVVAMLYSGVGAALAIKSMPNFNIKAFSEFFTRTVPNLTRGSTFLIGFFTVIGNLVKRLGSYLICKVYPQEGYYHRISEEMPTIKKWIDEVLYLDSIDMEVRVSTRMHIKDRIFAAYVFGQRILTHFAESKEAHMIIKIFDIIKKKYNIMVELGEHPFVRKEPFVLWMYGKTRVGKSYLTEHLSKVLLDSINYDLQGEARSYTIMPTNEFWSGCKQQPVLVMDDAFSVELPQTVERTLNYMYMIKSSCVLNPPQAALENKHHRYNPEIFYINSNKPFVNISGVDATAIHSRRDVLIKAEVIDSNRPTASDYSIEILKNFGHLKFAIHLNPSCVCEQWSEWMTYEELKTWLCSKFKSFYRTECKSFHRRLETYDSISYLSEEDALHATTLDDEINKLKALLEEEYERDLAACLYQKCANVYDRMCVWTSDYLNRIFNRFTEIEIRGQMMTLSKIYGQGNIVAEDDEIIVEDMIEEEDPLEGPSSMNVLPVALAYDNETLKVMKMLCKLYNFFPNDEKTDIFVKDKMYTHQNLYPVLLEYGIAHTELLLKPYKRLYHPLNNNALVLSFISFYLEHNCISKFRRVRSFTSLFTKLRPGLRIIYPGCQHLDALITWNTQTRTFTGKPDLKDECCNAPGECIYHSKIVNHLFACYVLLSDTHNFLRFTKTPDGDYLLRILYSENNSRSLLVQMKEWSESFSARAYTFIVNKIPAAILKVFKYMSIIGSIVTIFFVTFMSFKGIFNCVKSGWSYDNFVGPTTLTVNVVEKKSSALPVSVVGQGAGSYADPAHRVNPQVHLVPKPQGSEQNFNNLVKLIENNSFFIICEYTTKQGITGRLSARGLKVNGSVAVMIKHYFEEFDSIVKTNNNYIFYYISTKDTKGMRLEINYNMLKFKYFDHNAKEYGSNLVAVYLPKNVPLGRDIRNLFMTVEGHHLVGMSTSIYEYGKGHHYNINSEWCGPFQIAGTDTQSAVWMANAYTYGMHAKGMCGAILLAGGTTTSPIIGIHVAGGGKSGFAEPLYREMWDLIEYDVHGSKAEPTTVADLVINHEIAHAVNLETTVFIEGAVDPVLAHRETGQSAIIPSAIHGVFPVDTEINPLKPNDPRLPPGTSPMKSGCELMGIPVRIFNSQLLEQSKQDFMHIVLQNCKPLRRQVGILGVNEAIVGIPDLKYYEPLNWNTSPGFNFKQNVKNPVSGKKWLFNLKETNDGYEVLKIDQRLKHIMDEKECLRFQNIIPDTIFVDCLKDTCIPKEKCKIPGKTRIFSISPVDFTIQFKQYCGDFMASFTAARFDCEHAIGIAVNGEEWSALANLLQKRNGKYVTGDYSNFGPGLSLEVAHAAFDIIIEWYKYHGASDYHIKVLNVMKHEIVGARHLCFNVIYQVCCGIPSGSPITAILNSMVNSLYVRYAYYSLLKSRIIRQKKDWNKWFLAATQSSGSVLTFNENVTLVTYGDDLVMSVNKDIIDEFNFTTIASLFGLYNIKFTPADKGDVVVPYYENLQQLTFLSCGFKLHPRRTMQWLAPLKEISIHSCANWIRKKGDFKENTIVNMKQTLLLSFGHGPEFYQDKLNKLRKVGSKYNLKFPIVTWEMYDEMFFGTEFDQQLDNLLRSYLLLDLSDE